MKNELKNIIFDVGNVLFHYDPGYIIDCLLPETAHKEFYLEHLFHSDLWQQLDRGDITDNGVVRRLKQEHDISDEQSKDVLFLIQNFSLHLILNEDMKTLFEDCAKQFNVYILSNFQEKPFTLLLKQHPFMNQAKGIVVSSRVMMKKPELGIFHYLLTQYRILPEHSLFIDDLLSNINSAKRLLIKGIHHTSAKQTVKELKKHASPALCLS